ncbi:hypothetical protein DCAR_0728207 [Daucus carota subsp. sativus]|uniref:MATH domain-containing protein n=1 Tax=Daucus carota subsp. sativus TaxID=79200 RepID=A0A164TAM7_DAUCS|nr:PREDICTED: ubiquitin carboxyl-terminal hydrolase 12-like [Daucus carota subsp. sativus]WOH08759.1 hypothetical protein DCAR_0728207 [Daucus carota subsp. sativus]
MTMLTQQPLDQEDDEMLVPHQELVEGPQPVEGPLLVEGPQPMDVVAQTESTNAVDNQAADEPQASRFTWTIENFSRLNTKKQYSDVFVVGGFKCQEHSGLMSLNMSYCAPLMGENHMLSS